MTMPAAIPDRAGTGHPGARRSIRRELGVAPRRFLRATVSGTLAAASGIGLLATSGWLITRASERPPVFTLSVAIGAVQAFALGRGITRYFERLGVHDVALDALGRLRLNLYDTLEPRVPGGLADLGSGAVLSAFVADAEIIATAFAKKLTATIDLSASIVLGTGVAVLVAPSVGAVLAAGALAMVVVAGALARVGRSGIERETVARTELANSVVDTMRVARELVAFGREDLVASRLAEIRRRSEAGAARRALGTGLARAGTTFAAAAALVAVVASGIAVHDAGHLSGVLLAVEAFVALAVYDQVASLPLVLADTAAARAATRRLAALAALETPVDEPHVDSSPAAGAIEVALDAVGVTHGGTVALAGLSLVLPPGRRMALVGRSGSGKTSALYALLHFVPCASGRATIGGVDVARMTRTGIARHVGWMAEATHVFATSLGENLRIAAVTASDAECVAALGRVGLASWFASLADGLTTTLGAGGRAMSAGERQRLGLARALLAGGTVLLLDEPTAHIDPTSSTEVLDALVGAVAARSLLIISHEPDVARLVDDIVTLDGGRVVGRARGARRTSLDECGGGPPGTTVP
jgi:thiol reductant ABC exporter CydC subunit